MSTAVSKSATPVADLPTLARELNRGHREVQAYARRALGKAKRNGEYLNEAKKHVAHGRWLTWIKENLEFSDRTAQGYMKISENWRLIEEQQVNSVRDALALIATQKTAAIEKKPKPKAAPVEQMIGKISKLSQLERKKLYEALHKEFG